MVSISTVQNAPGFQRLPDLGMHRHIGLKIVKLEQGPGYNLIALGDPFPIQEFWETKIPLAEVDLFRAIQDCRDVWEARLVKHRAKRKAKHGGEEAFYPFATEIDHTGRTEVVQQIGAILALAGHQLFCRLFEANCDALTQDQAERRRGIANRLKGIMADPATSLVISITSDDCFVPWNLLYTHPSSLGELQHDGSNFDWRGFWGARHILEHNTRQAPIATRVAPEADEPLRFSFNFDQRIDGVSVKCIQPQLEFFDTCERLDFVKRTHRNELELALRETDFKDRIMYFCCHGRAAGPGEALNLGNARFTLSDGDDITAANIAYWMGDRAFARPPVVFVNACQGGQMQTLFYHTFATELLRRKAACLLGSQFDIPAEFASFYARRFFNPLLTEGARVGALMQKLTAEFLEQFHNPLALAYSLYRGIDCYVEH